MLLKPNMVLSGYDGVRAAPASTRSPSDARAASTRHVPAAVPGIVFLSGGQTDEDATAHLNAMNARGPHPWQLSFSYGRALQAPALKAWGGEPENVAAGQAAYLHRAKMNGARPDGQLRAGDGDGRRPSTAWRSGAQRAPTSTAARERPSAAVRDGAVGTGHVAVSGDVRPR